MGEKNIKLSFMSHWKGIPYKSIPNFRDFYYEDKTNGAYYQSWDMILKYTVACGFDGIETFANRAEMDAVFGGPTPFREYVEEKGLKISGMFSGMGPGHIKENIPDCVKNALDNGRSFFVTLKDADSASRENAKLIARAINLAFSVDLSE